MAFWGNKFIFNGIPCETLDLMVYDIGDNTQGTSVFANTVTIVESHVGHHWKPMFHGVKFEKKQEIELVFGVNQYRIDSHKYLDRYEMDNVSSWLAGHDTYLWLEIEQDDMEYIRYKCIVTSLEVVSYGNVPWAFKATFTCDGPYAYMQPREYTYQIDGAMSIDIYNPSSHNGPIYPEVEISLSSGNSFSIQNVTDNGRTTSFQDIPSDSGAICINGNSGVISCESGDNLYPCFNFRYPRMLRGTNTFVIRGYGTLTIRCDYPISVGG